MRPLDLKGKKFGRLTVLEQAPHKLGSHTRWRCVCECGKETIIRGSSLSQNLTQSCGCLVSELGIEAKTKHGLYYNRSYATWRRMLFRCHNEASPDYKDYGERGIFVCERWHNLDNFIADMGERPPLASIDRIDNSRGYEPGNCRWSNPVEQANNRRSNVYYFYEGKKQTITQWERELGFLRGTLRARLSKGVPFVRAIEDVPFQRLQKYKTDTSCQ